MSQGDRRVFKIDIVAFHKARVRRGLSLAEIARRIGRQPGTVQNAASGKANPYLATLKAIADELGVEPGSLVEQEGPEPDPDAGPRAGEAGGPR